METPSLAARNTGTSRPVTSVLILIHLFCVLTVLSSNQLASTLQHRLRSTLAVYTRTLYFDPVTTTGYHLTHAVDFEDDHVLMVETAGGAQVYPDEMFAKGSFAWRRTMTFTKRLAEFVTSEDEDAAAELIASVSKPYVPQIGDRITVRLLRRRPMDWNDPMDRVQSDRSGDDFLETVYVADAWRDSLGQVNVYRQVAPREAAPPTRLLSLPAEDSRS